MTAAHLHLLVNHVPILGAAFALALLAASLLWAPDVLRRTALVTLVVVGAAAFVADRTGEPAEDAVRGLPGITRATIHEHEEMAEKSWLAAGVLGLVSIVVLVRWRRTPIPAPVGVGMLAGTAVVAGMMAYTGLLGGRIRHTEFRPGATAADAALIEPRRARPPRPSGPEE
ncbi:MAG TPA: hypothetical protein VFH27_17735 [Longimicrobiaceae bacterium]|nr:hypothetical protein [Longimicrobiaceae bacterium]